MDPFTLGKLSVKQASVGGSSPAPTAKAIAQLFKLIDHKRHNQLTPHRLGRKLEKRADLSGSLIGAGIGGLAGGLLAPDEHKGTGILAGAGLGALGGLGSGAPTAAKTTATVAKVPSIGAAPSIAPETGAAIGEGYDNALAATAGRARTLPGAARAVYNWPAKGWNMFSGAVNRTANFLGHDEPLLGKAPLIPKLPALATKAMPWIDKEIPGLGISTAEGALPVLNEVANFKRDPTQDMASSTSRTEDLVGKWNTHRDGLNWTNTKNVIKNPYVLGAVNPAFIAANTLHDLVTGARSAYQAGGYGNVIRQQEQIQADPSVLEGGQNGSLNMLGRVFEDGFANNAARGVTKDPVAMAGYLGKQLINRPNFNDPQAAEPARLAQANKLTASLGAANKDFSYKVSPDGRTMMVDRATGRPFLPNAAWIKQHIPPEMQQGLEQRTQSEIPDIYANMIGGQ